MKSKAEANSMGACKTLSRPGPEAPLVNAQPLTQQLQRSCRAPGSSAPKGAAQGILWRPTWSDQWQPQLLPTPCPIHPPTCRTCQLVNHRRGCLILKPIVTHGANSDYLRYQIGSLHWLAHTMCSFTQQEALVSSESIGKIARTVWR